MDTKCKVHTYVTTPTADIVLVEKLKIPFSSNHVYSSTQSHLDTLGTPTLINFSRN